MKADFSRDTFDPTRGYRRVLGQQGRVVIDADRNEQTSIDLAIEEQTTSDVIGPSGVPETSLSTGYNGGFAIGLSADGSDLTIAHGRMYVEGVLLENAVDTTLAAQPFLPLAAGAFGPAGVMGDGLYGVYLDAFERVVTPVDDPRIVETALGGPDTSLRSQLAWQVRLGKIDTERVGTTPTCSAIPPPWGTPADKGLLAARGGAPSADPLPCVLPPQTGFRSLENQLYRIEIHTSGRFGSATFKWSRENGSVIAGITSQLTGSYSSPTFSVQTVGRDRTLGFKPGDWVELIDDSAEFQGGVGELLQCGKVDPDSLTIALQTNPSRTIDPAKHPKLRRWDQQTNASATGVPIADGSWIDLENGVQVRFSDASFNVGDYWLIPARTATSVEAAGTVDWPLDPATNAPAFEAPRGVKHYHAKLAIVGYARGAFIPPQGAAGVTDCRSFFPPLTALQTQPSPCTLVLTPGTDWVAEIESLFANAPALDAELCFATGTFNTSRPAVIATSGNVKVSGAGWGTKLVGAGIDAVLQFNGCASAVVRDLAATASTVDGPPDVAGNKASRVIRGALDFAGCGEVLVENVSLACGAALLPGAACLVIRSDPAVNSATGTGTARVRASQFAVGEMQYGILLVHQQRAFVDGNTISTLLTARLRWVDKLKSPLFQQELVHVIVGNAVLVPARSSSSSGSSSSSSTIPGIARARVASAANAMSRINAGVSVGGKTVQFASPAAIGNVWQTYLDLHGPKEFATTGDLYAYVQKTATVLVTDPNVRAQFPSFDRFFNTLQHVDATLGQRGIVVGGRAMIELRIRNNSIDRMMQGITAGVSHREKRPPALPADSIQHVTISGNVVNAEVDAVRGHSKARWAIFVGNANNIMIENNDAGFVAPAFGQLHSDGIRVYGHLGKKMIVRHNHIHGFTRDIFVRALLPTGPKHDAVYWYTTQPKAGTNNTNLWLVVDNVCESNVIDAVACTQYDNWY